MIVNDIEERTEQAKQRLGIIGNNPAMLAAIGRAVRVAPIDLSVLITGESGTGKEFFPKIIHSLSPRKHAGYIAVNCGAIPEGTIDSELFGHEKGSFTGALSSRKGYFEEADGGTIFLDEVAELPLTTQARLLRVLETGEFIKVGSSEVQRCNVRIVAATNVDMAKAVAEGRFREDLYYRLSTVSIAIPPLRDRGNDILLMARRFAADFAERYTMPKVLFTDDAARMLLHYRWPGNVRQLKNLVEQVALFESGREVDADTLQGYLPVTPEFMPVPMAPSAHAYETEREALFGTIVRMQQQIDALTARVADLSSRPLRNVGTFDPGTDVITPMGHDVAPTTRSIVKFEPFATELPPREAPARATLEDTERDTIRRALERNGGRRKLTADELNISERTLYRKIKEYGLE